jgi:acyl-CoA reductase-like NAD-dependent aldehyde dehydrogenase
MRTPFARPRPATAPEPETLVPGSVRAAQARWADRPLAERLAVVRLLRGSLAVRGGALARLAHLAHLAPTSGVGGARSEAEVLSAEVIPLADACRFLEEEAPALLAPAAPAGRRPAWLGGVEVELRREPLGVVLVIAASNYPLFLPGVQAVQALAAGNAVLLKPGDGGLPAARALAGLLAEAGLPEGLLTVLPEGDEAARSAVAAGPDLVLLTGSAETGRALLSQLAPRLVPAALELSGCDALFVLPGADRATLERAARALAFGLGLNGGATCIAPRRVFVPRALAAELEAALLTAVAGLPPATVPAAVASQARELAAEAVSAGARLLCGNLEAPPEAPFAPLVVADARPGMRLLAADLFAPVLALVPVADAEEALAAAGLCPYALGASVFGPQEEARQLAGRVRAGVVVVNDVIVPTADPRLPFGGRGQSGFGVTRGAEGLLALTAVKAVAVRRGRFLPHLDRRSPHDADLFRAYLAAVHGRGPRARLGGAMGVIQALARILLHRSGRRAARSGQEAHDRGRPAGEARRAGAHGGLD